jgi:CRISPR-associated protein Csm1
MMNAGGRFVILAPGDPAALQALNDEAAAMAADFRADFGGHVALTVGTFPFPAQDLARFGQLLAKADAALSRAKAHPLAGALQPGGRWDTAAFLEPPPEVGVEPCPACGRELIRPGEEELCHSCRLDVYLGRLLPRAASIAIYNREVPGGLPLLGDWQFQIGQPGARLSPNALAVLDLRGAPPEPAPGPVYQRDLMAHIPLGPADMAAFCGDCRLCELAERDKVEPGKPIYFDCLAVHGEGRPLLGYLKADVDRLGSLFVMGFQPAEPAPGARQPGRRPGGGAAGAGQRGAGPRLPLRP